MYEDIHRLMPDVPSHVDAGSSARDKARMRGSPVPDAGISSLKNSADSHPSAKVVAPEKLLEAEPAAPKVTAEVINTNFYIGTYAAKTKKQNDFLENK